MINLEGNFLLPAVHAASAKLFEQIGSAFPSCQFTTLIGDPFDLRVLHEGEIELDSFDLDGCERHPSAVASSPGERILDARAQRRGQPPLFSSPVLEASGPVSQVGTPATTTIARSLSHSLVDFFSSMREFGQMHPVMDLALLRLLHTHQSHSGRFRPRIEFECHWLEMAAFHTSVLEPNGKWHHPMHHGSFSGKQQACSFL